MKQNRKTIKDFLYPDRPLTYSPQLARAIGLNESIILQQIEFWLQTGSGKVVNGRRWIYNTCQEWQTQFPFWSESTIRRILTKLKKMGLIDTKQFDKNKLDRTTWYAINYEYGNFYSNDNEETISSLRDGQNEPIEDMNLTNGQPSQNFNEVPLNSSLRSSQFDHIEVVNLTTSNTYKESLKDTYKESLKNKDTKNVQGELDDPPAECEVAKYFYDKLKEMGIEKTKRWYGQQIGLAKILLKKFPIEDIKGVVDWALDDLWWAGAFNSLGCFEKALQQMKGREKSGKTGSTGGNTQDVHGGRYTEPGYYDEPEFEELIKRQREKFGM